LLGKRKYIAPSPLDRAPYFAWLSILTGGALTPSICSLSNIQELCVIKSNRTKKKLKNNEKYKCVNYRNNITFAMELDKSCEECAASKDSKNDASSGLSISQTCTWMII